MFLSTMTALSVARPAAWAMAMFARTPVDTRTRSAAIFSPSATTPSTCSAPLISSIFTPTLISMPFCFATSVRMRTVSGSTLPAIRTGAPSRTVTFSFAFLSSQAASRPRTPPPITTAFFAPSFASALTFSTSLIPRMDTTSGRSLPLKGGMKLEEPSAYTHLS